MDLLLQLLVIGISQAAAFALIATGFGLVLAVNHVFHFAHAAIFALAGFLIYTFVVEMGLNWPLAIVLTAAISVALAVGIDLGIYKPIERHGNAAFGVVLASIGLQFALESAMALIWGSSGLTLPVPFTDAVYALGDVTITTKDLLTVAISIVGIGGTLVFLYTTPVGNSIRAVADNPVMAKVVGISPTWVGALAMAMATLLVIPAAIIVGWYSSLFPTMGMNPLLYAVAAVVVGGIGSIPGACLGALILGILGAVLSVGLPALWSDTLTFVIMMLCVLWFPAGLLGRRARGQAAR
jgi:branched-chain amino acid transport system permease protein